MQRAALVTRLSQTNATESCQVTAVHHTKAMQAAGLLLLDHNAFYVTCRTRFGSWFGRVCLINGSQRAMTSCLFSRDGSEPAGAIYVITSLLACCNRCHNSCCCSAVTHHLCFCSAGLDTSSRPCLLSLDCEMCQTATNVRELIGLSVVNETGSTVLKV